MLDIKLLIVDPSVSNIPSGINILPGTQLDKEPEHFTHKVPFFMVALIDLDK